MIPTGPGQWKARCPAHADHDPSLSVRDAGKILVHCFAGCSPEAIVAARGLSLADLDGRANGHPSASGDPRMPPMLTVNALAEAKRLPVEFLQAQGLENGRGHDAGCVLIPYYNRDSQLIASKKRSALSAKDGSRWPKGQQLAAYGQWKLSAEWRDADWFILVEGESDCWAAWFHGVPCLGLPGASAATTLQPEYLDGISRLWVLREPDDGGGGFVRGVGERLRRFQFSGEVYVVTMPAGIKDLADLHADCPERFQARLWAQLEAAERLDLTTKNASEAAPSAEGAPTWTFHDAAEAWDFPPRAWLIDDLLPRRGVMWVAGVPHAGKSLLILYCCLALATRRPTVAAHFAIRGEAPSILFVSREDGGDRLAARRADILAAWGLTPAAVPPGALTFLIREPVDLLNPAHTAQLVAYCRTHAVRVLVLDTWTALSPGADPDSAKGQAALGASMVVLSEAIDGLVVIVDHARKNPPSGAEVSMADIYGPNQKAQKAEHALVLRRLKGHDRRLDVLMDSKDTDGPLRFFLDRSAVDDRARDKFTYAGTVEAGAARRRALGTENRDRVWEATPGEPEWGGMEEIRKALSLGPGGPLAPATVRAHLGALVEEGRVRRKGFSTSTQYQRIAAEGPIPAGSAAHG